ncbi:hypothetical protein, partial [Xanthovirga aplysinae]|uniref:hypothetical protein n=1 Tax=Xanthovirga aplysinae TaxID=2529853 RepID=UPI0016572913
QADARIHGDGNDFGIVIDQDSEDGRSENNRGYAVIDGKNNTDAIFIGQEGDIDGATSKNNYAHAQIYGDDNFDG